MFLVVVACGYIALEKNLAEPNRLSALESSPTRAAR